MAFGATLVRYFSSFPLLAALAAALCLCTGAQAEQSGAAEALPDTPQVRRAFQLFDEFRHVEALPLLQKLAGENPRNALIWERLGIATLAYAATLPSRDQRKKTRASARAILVKAQELGDNSNLVQVLLNDIPQDGGEHRFSQHKDVDAAMNQAEAEFSRGNLAKAIEGYKRAHLLAPDLYEAALFAGDAYFKQRNAALAGEWFARAIQIDPNRETAYRYWGDTYMREGKTAEARAKFIDAIVAEPYSQRAWIGLKQWADANRVSLVGLQLPKHVSPGPESEKTDAAPDKTVPLDAAWAAYDEMRARWRREKFQQEFPAESAYRHTAREEAEALHALAAALRKQPELPAEDPLAALLRIDKARLLEACVYISRADREIAVDYPAYREAHRDLVRNYLDKFVVPLSIGGR